MEIEPGLQSIIDEYFSTSDYKIVETIFRGEKGTKVLEIFVDNRIGINIDEITRINKDLSSLIDEKYVINDISNLVVSSPGAERPLRFLWQLEKHAGRTLEIELNDSEHIEGKLLGISENSGDGRIKLEIPVKEKGKKLSHTEREINFKDVKEVKVKISFSKK
ncbi:MAG: ribosome assembly cofactor RimP [Ignavibacteria bacterium]|nr:ribosome assembly cofactor RimP [Ignavibacteria bacterium]